MVEKKLTVRVDEAIYEPFKAECQANDFTVGEVLTVAIEECNTIINLAIAKREKEIREAKEAQILKLQEELGYTESDMKKLLKNSKPAAVKPAKKTEKVLESRQAHEGTYEGEAVMWEVDRLDLDTSARHQTARLIRKMSMEILFPRHRLAY